MMRRVLLSLVGAVALLTSASATEEDTPFTLGGITGHWYTVTMGLDSYVVRIEFDMPYNGSLPNALWNLDGYQKSTFVNGQEQTMTPRTFITTRSAGGSGVHQVFYLLSDWADSVAAKTDPWRVGSFDWVLTYKTSSGAAGTTSVKTQVVHLWNPNDTTVGGSGNPPGVGANADTEEDQNNFWTNLFVPDEEHLNAFKDAAAQLLNWGPLGIYQVLASEAGGQGTSSWSDDPINKPYWIPFSIKWNSEHEAVQTGFDLSAYEGWIKAIRLLFLGLLWWTTAMFIFQSAVKKS